MPLVTVFHCVSCFKANTVLFHLSPLSPYPFFLFCCLIHILFLFLHASDVFLLSGPLCYSCCLLVSFETIPFSLLSSFFSPVIFIFPPYFFMLSSPTSCPQTFRCLLPFSFSAFFWVDGSLFSCVQTTLKSFPISDQAPGVC